MAASIPILNVYYLLCYAWRHYEEMDRTEIGHIKNPTVPNLLATILVHGVQRLVRRGLDRGYVIHTDDLSCLRGNIEVGETIKRSLLLDRRIACSFDEFDHDILPNQILKTIIGRLSRIEAIDTDLSNKLRRVRRAFDGVSELRLSRSMFRRVHLHRNNRSIEFLMRVCELIHGALIPSQSGEGARFSDIFRDERKMARIFEDFVRGFYAAEQSLFAVKRDRFPWNASALDETKLAWLPTMETDISLRSQDRTILIDTKYYIKAFQENYGSRSVRSENLYQLFAYLKNIEVKGDVTGRPEGILLYPVVDGPFDLKFAIDNHFVRVAGIDLSQDWVGIRADLLDLLSENSPSPPEEGRAKAAKG